MAPPEKAPAVLKREEAAPKVLSPQGPEEPKAGPKEEQIPLTQQVEETEVPTKIVEPPKPDEKKPDDVVRKPVDRAKKDEEAKEPDTPSWKGKRIPKQEEEPEKVQLKPFAKKPSGSPEQKEAPEPKEKIPTEILPPGKAPEEEISKEPKTQLKDIDRQKVPDKEVEKKPVEVPQVEEKKELPKKVTPVEKDVPPKKEEEKKPLVIKKGSLPKEPEKKEEVVLKPVEPSKKGLEPKKTPTPKVDQAKPIELKPVERKPSTGVTKKPIPEKVSPKDSIESVTLKKVPKKVSPKEEKTEEIPAIEKPTEVPLVKELSPGVVQMRKVSTQMEEEVFEEEMLEVEEEDEEETWGWELAPQDSYGSEDLEYLEEGALETPGMPGGRRGERVALAPHH
ncbi:hypothetical protein AOLI_G00090500 [Acnodon oligacanthus]